MASTVAENAPEEVIAAAIETKVDEPKAAKTMKTPKENKPKAPKGPKLAPAHPPYFQV